MKEVVRMECLLCGGRRRGVVFEEFDVQIVKCRDCGHVFSAFPRGAHYDGFWGDAVADGDHTYWRKARARMFDDFIARFVAGRSGCLLDMGCGLGFFLAKLSQHETWRSYGCEISPAAVRYAREELRLPDVMCSRLEDVDLAAETFDIVTMWDVIDHLLDPDPVLKRCYSILRDGGMCFIRTPNIAMQLPRARLKKRLWGMRPDVAYLQGRDHLHHYSARSIRRLLERNGFVDVEFVHLRPVDSMNRAESRVARGAREVWFQTVRALAVVSKGRLNYNNLFVVARKRVPSSEPGHPDVSR